MATALPCFELDEKFCSDLDQFPRRAYSSSPKTASERQRNNTSFLLKRTYFSFGSHSFGVVLSSGATIFINVTANDTISDVHGCGFYLTLGYILRMIRITTRTKLYYSRFNGEVYGMGRKHTNTTTLLQHYSMIT